jgi:hypothetical protein
MSRSQGLPTATGCEEGSRGLPEELPLQLVVEL